MTKVTGNMALTIDAEVYGQLLSKYQPRVITTQAESRKFSRIVEELHSRNYLTPEEDILLELLLKLIDDFEDKHSHLNISNPRSILVHLMEARSLSQAGLTALLGSSQTAAKVLHGELELNQEQAEILGRFFQIDANLFVKK
jgi:HTH-type transcriptional regulator / antitoxin HigA